MPCYIFVVFIAMFRADILIEIDEECIWSSFVKFLLLTNREDLDRAQAKWLDELSRYEDAHMGNMRRIYPAENTEKYDKYFHSSGSLYQETAAFKARSECAR